MTRTVIKDLTFEEFERLPDKPGKLELLKGELIELPPAKLKHSEIAERIFLRLHNWLTEAHARGEAGGTGQAHHEMGYKFPDGSWLNLMLASPTWTRRRKTIIWALPRWR